MSVIARVAHDQPGFRNPIREPSASSTEQGARTLDILPSRITQSVVLQYKNPHFALSNQNLTYALA